jgi:hypothetical protein
MTEFKKNRQKYYYYYTTIGLLTVLVAAAVGFSFPQQMYAAPENAKSVFTARLSGDEEVADPPVETSARGTAIFKLSKDGESLSYRLTVSNIDQVTMAHIHKAPVGVNGPAVAWLLDVRDEPTGQVNGVLASGTITADDLVEPLAGQPLSDLISDLRQGNLYVNVHTLDYPAGEIRGQIS